MRAFTCEITHGIGPRAPVGAAAAVSLALTLLAGVAWAGNPHVHGTGALDIVVEGALVELDLTLPAHDVVGFERAPSTREGRAAVEKALAALRDANSMFALSSDARCTLSAAQVESPFNGVKSGHRHAQPAEAHSDFRAAYRFQCAEPTKLDYLGTHAFKHFKRLGRIEVRMVGASGQRKARMTARQPEAQLR